MDTRHVLELLTAAGQLALGVVVYRRVGGRTPVALPLALLCFLFAAWNFANWAYGQSAHVGWRGLEVGLSPWIAPLSLHVVLAFVGAKQAYRVMQAAAYVGFGLLSATSVPAVFSPWARGWVDSDAWSIAYFVPFTLILGFAVHLLMRHVHRSSDESERMRGRLMLVAVGVGGAIGTTELLDDFMALPRIGVLGSLVSTAMFAVVTLRLRLFRREASTSAVLYAAGLGVIAIIALQVLFRHLEASGGLLVLGSLTVTGLLVAALRPLFVEASARREHNRRLVGLGRFAEQMAHDIRNPLAAMRGAAQFLLEERRQGRSLDDRSDFLDLMLAQLSRVEGIVDRYHRLGHCVPHVRTLDLNDVVRQVLSLHGFGPGSAVHVHLELADDLPPCEADADLLGSAIENLVRNAAEAMPDGGTVTVRTAVDLDRAGEPRFVVTVEDQGMGMDARQMEWALEPLHTTKPGGSGLGLLFVRRVASAHGGLLDLESEPGIGTRARLVLPRVARGGAA